MTDITEPGGKVRLYVDELLGENMRLTPTPEQSHYLLHVMRAKPGERVGLFNGRDGEWRAEIAEVSKRSCVLRCQTQTAPQTSSPDLWLVFAPIKKTPADYVTQKATELGVRVLQPAFTRRSIVTRVNLGRMRANSIEAAEQSGRTDIPEIGEPLALEKLLAAWPRERKLLFCDEAGDAPAIAGALENADSDPWAILTGPEGGFDPKERETIRALPGAVPVSLGARILRADTAALAALAVWQSLRGDWR